MQIAYCANCGKVTGHKRALGAGTVLGAFVTGGASLAAVPFYGKRCIICGLTVEQATSRQDVGMPMPRQTEITPDSQQNSESVSTRDQATGWLVLLGVVVFIAICWASIANAPSAIPGDNGQVRSVQQPSSPTGVPQPKGHKKRVVHAPAP
jgi:hypothetical protein